MFCAHQHFILSWSQGTHAHESYRNVPRYECLCCGKLWDSLGVEVRRHLNIQSDDEIIRLARQCWIKACKRTRFNGNDHPGFQTSVSVVIA